MSGHVAEISQDFVARLTACQQSLYAFIHSLVPNASDARDILAETNLALWRKREEYDPKRDFWPWACRFARLQVLAFRKQQQRDRLVFKEDVIDLLASEAEAVTATSDRANAALESCLGEIDARRQELLRKRYADGHSVKRLSAEMNLSVGAMADLLYRVRLQLARCIERKLAAME
jgi:RNA polymerase sigma-70 factor (ECF subfamily)